jgi:hypothetical protein
MLDIHDRYYILGCLMTASGFISICLDPIIGLIGMVIGLIELFTAQNIRRKVFENTLKTAIQTKRKRR